MKYIIVLLTTIIVALGFHTNGYSQQKRFDSIEIQFKGLEVHKFGHNRGGHCGSEYDEFDDQPRQWVFKIKTDTTIVDTMIFISDTQLGLSDVRSHYAKFFIVFHSNFSDIDSFLFHYVESYNVLNASNDLQIIFTNVHFFEDDNQINILLDSLTIKKSGFYYNSLTEYHNNGLCQLGEFFTNVLYPNCSVVVTLYKHDPNSYTKQMQMVSDNNLIVQTIASATINIHLQNRDDNKLIITDLLGREVLTRQIGEGEEDISVNVASLLKGVYWVRVGSRIQKFIVQH